jgi:hypothetical protein
MKKTLRSIKGIAFLLFCNISSALAQIPDSCTFIEDNNNILTVEMESTNINGTFWTKQNEVPGYTGSGYLEYTGGTSTGIPGESQISYTFRITTAGRYSFKVRGFRSNYEDNDVWVRFPQGGVMTKIESDSTGTKGNNWFKALIGPRNEWFYFTKTQNPGTPNPEKMHDIYVDFPAAGIYSVEFSGRSTGFKLDRFTLYKTSGFYGMDIDNPESATENCQPYSNTTNTYVANPIPDQTVDGNQIWNFTFAANTFANSGSVPINYIAYLSGVNPLPSWMSFNPSTRTFSGNPTYNDGGKYLILVKGQDINGTYALDAFELTVVGNHPPTVENELADSVANVGDNFTYAIPANTFSDQDGHVLSLSISSNSGSLPSWLSYDASSKSFTGTPSTGDVGTDTIYVTANDGFGGEVTDQFLIYVKSVNIQGTRNQRSKIITSVYPNPAENILKISMEETGTGSLSLSDQLGRIYITQENIDLSKEVLLDLSSMNLISGLYILKIRSEVKGSEYSGIIVKR